MKYDRAEAVRYFGARSDDSEAGVLTDIAYLKLRNEIQPRSVYRIYDCIVNDVDVVLNGESFKSRKLAEHLVGCRKVALLAVTLGSKTDVALRRIALQNVAEGAAAQAVCAALVESLCDDLEKKIIASCSYAKFCSRFSPGYGDWSLEDQPKILRMLEADKKIGLSVTESNMLAPIKSVTAILGLAIDGNISNHLCDNKCLLCPNRECEYRKE